MGPVPPGADVERRHARLHRHAQPQHDAFLVDDQEFDTSFAKIRKAGIPYYAHPNKSGAGEINHLYGGRGVYFEDPDGHMLELITKPYGDPPG